MNVHATTRRACAVAAMAGALFVPATQVAHADTLRTVRCDDGIGDKLVATVTTVVSGDNDKFSQFTFRLTGGTGGKSNVNIDIFSNSQAVWHRDSPDDLKSNVYYVVNANSKVGPRPPVYVNRYTSEKVRFTAIFDHSGHDTSCVAETRPF